MSDNARDVCRLFAWLAFAGFLCWLMASMVKEERARMDRVRAIQSLKADAAWPLEPKLNLSIEPALRH